jgi:hypothetical protein
MIHELQYWQKLCEYLFCYNLDLLTKILWVPILLQFKFEVTKLL